jgi:hypothetical protein
MNLFHSALTLLVEIAGNASLLLVQAVVSTVGP